MWVNETPVIDQIEGMIVEIHWPLFHQSHSKQTLNQDESSSVIIIVLAFQNVTTKVHIIHIKFNVQVILFLFPLSRCLLVAINCWTIGMCPLSVLGLCGWSGATRVPNVPRKSRQNIDCPHIHMLWTTLLANIWHCLYSILLCRS